MVDLFKSPRQKITQARKSMEELRDQEKAFNAREPYTRLVETDPEGWNQTHTVRLTEPLPENFAALTRAVAESFCTALDQAVFAASKAAGGTRLMDTCFPIADSRAAFDKIADQKCKGVPSEIMAIVRGSEPFKGGNGLLWGLQEIIRAEEYFLIVPIGSAESGLTFIHNETPPEVRWDAKKKELEFGTFPIHGVFNRALDVFFSAGFGQAESLKGQRVLPVLEAMGEEVERIVSALQTESESLGSVSE
jgi:hypothetical protein